MARSESKGESQQVGRCRASKPRATPGADRSAPLPADEIQAKGNTTRSSHHKYSINEDK